MGHEANGDGNLLAALDGGARITVEAGLVRAPLRLLRERHIDGIEIRDAAEYLAVLSA